MIGRLRTISNSEKEKADKDYTLYEDMLFDSDSLNLNNWWDQLWFIYYVWMKKMNLSDVPNPSYQKNHEKEYETGPDMAYGKPHYLTPEETKRVYDFLASTDSRQLVEYALTQKHNDMLYPHDWPQDIYNGLDPTGYMNSLNNYYKKAVDLNAGMLQVIVS
jgi:hypothetical protein